MNNYFKFKWFKSPIQRHRVAQRIIKDKAKQKSKIQVFAFYRRLTLDIRVHMA